MRIKWIELNGFKSFPDRIKIELNDGITCFVGPNGAGKSNIVDAFRWILGEHNPRILRGEKMEEIIFQGSATKKERGLAEVTIFLVKKERSENGKEPQVRDFEIKRRLFRTGESFFIINGKNSRLKDIKEIFVSEGVDIRTYAIVDQLKLNEILFKPYFRKILLEECSGISLYKMKKAETEIKLQSAKENLQRIEDILGELKNQYSILERQAKKAEKYKKIIEELGDLELKTAKAESLFLLNELTQIREEIQKLDSIYKGLKGENHELILKIDECKEKISQTEKQIQQLQHQIKQKEDEKAKLEKDLAIILQEEKSKYDNIERLKEENSYICKEIDKLQFESNEIMREVEEIHIKIDTLQTSIIALEESLLNTQKNTEETQKAIDRERKFLFNLSAQIVDKKNILSSTRKNLDLLRNNLKSLLNRKKDAVDRLKEREEELFNISMNIENLKVALNKQETYLKDQIIIINHMQRDLDDLNQRLLNAKKEEAFLIGKIEALSSEIWDETSTNKLFIDCFEVLPGAEDLVELWFDEKLKAEIIESIENIKKIEGRKIFLIKEFSKEQSSHEKPELKSLRELVKIKEPDLNESIFENVFIVNELKDAIEKKREYPNFSFVTKEGAVVLPDGFVKVGKVSDLLKKKRLLEDLKTKREHLISEIEELGKKIEKTTKEKENLSSHIENRKNDISKIKEQLFQLQERYKEIKREIEGLKQREKYLENEEKTIQREIEENTKISEKLSIEIEDLSITIDETETKIEGLKDREREIIKNIESTRELLSKSKIELFTLKERLHSKKSQNVKISEDINKFIEKKRKNEEEILKYNRKIEELKVEQQEKREKLELINSEISSIGAKLSQLLSSLSQVRENLDNLQLKYKDTNENLQTISSQLGDKKAKESELSIRLESIWNEIYNLYGKDIFNLQVSPIQAPEQAKERIIQLKARLKEIGTVDLDILKEYEEIKERYHFMLEQQKDIRTSIEELEEAIRKVNNVTRKKLRETFEQLRDRFNSIFQELFGGGKAELILTDDSNIIDSEIEIEIQPPGKKMANINLLSGGEKTLTALAFIFACLSIRPSPICILDEVDAPLDDPNTLKLRKLIKELSETIQFLIITHNKLMMECADYIYGVTMQEEGVSTVISLELKEAEAYA